MTSPLTPEVLVQALAYLKPHETNNGTISLKAPEVREAVAIIEAAHQQITAERDAKADVLAEMKLCAEASAVEREGLLAELARLRTEGEGTAVVPLDPTDGMQEDGLAALEVAIRTHGKPTLPGFAAAHVYRAMVAARPAAEGGAKDRWIALSGRVKAQLEVAQNALVKIDHGGKPMREIAARALLDIAMVPYPEEAAALARAAKEEQADA